MSGIDLEKSIKVIERILNSVKSETFHFDDKDIKITFSAGISNCTEISQNEMMDKLIKMADQRMYHAKNMGKNQVVFNMKS